MSREIAPENHSRCAEIRAAATDPVLSQTGQRSGLRQHFSWLLMGNLIYAGCQWALLSLLARLGTPELVGQLVLALAVTSPIMALFLFQLRSVQATDTGRDFQFGHYLALRLAALAAALLTAAVVCAVLPQGRAATWMILAVALSACVDGISDTAYGLLQHRERFRMIACSMILRGLASVVTFGLTIFFTGNLLLAVLIGSMARLIVASSIDLPCVNRVLRDEEEDWRPRWDLDRLVGLAKIAAPLGLVTTLIALNNSIPRYFIEKSLGDSPLGIFGAIGYVTVIGTLIVAALGQSASPRFVRSFARGNKSEFLGLYWRLIGICIGLGAAGLVISMTASRFALTILYGPEYATHGDLLFWMMVAGAINYVASISGYAITAAHCIRAQLPLFALVAATNAAASFWLIPSLGLNGAALSLILSALMQLSGTLVILWSAVAISMPIETALPLPSVETIGETA